jgi:hypothetical protein
MRFRSDPAKIRGSIAPVVSPFTADGAPDLDGLGAAALDGPVARVAGGGL